MSTKAAEKAKNALSVLLWSDLDSSLKSLIQGAAIKLGVTVAFSSSVQEMVELAAFSPRILVICGSNSREELVHCVTLAKLLALRIRQKSGRLFLLVGSDMELLAPSLRRYGFHDINTLAQAASASLWESRFKDALQALIPATELKIETELHDQDTPESDKINSQPAGGAPKSISAPATASPRVRNLPPIEHVADFWIRPKMRGSEPTRIANRWRIKLRGPSPVVGGWFAIPSPQACLQAPHDQEPGWWEWRFRDGLMAPTGNEFNPKEFESDRYRWVAHGTEPWAESDHWHFSGSFPLLALLEGTGRDAKIIAIRFIGRSETLLDITYDSMSAQFLAPRIAKTWEQLSRDILKVRSIDPSHFRSAPQQRPDAAGLMSQLEAAAPALANETSPAHLPEGEGNLEQASIGPAQFFKRFGGMNEFELRWLYTEWLLESGMKLGRSRTPSEIHHAMTDLAVRWFEFAKELVLSVRPQVQVELWQETDAGLDLLRKVDFPEESDKTTDSREMAFTGLSSLPGTRGFSKRSSWGASHSERPLGVALILRQENDPQTLNLPIEISNTLERVTEFIAQTLPLQAPSTQSSKPRLKKPA